jgi:hypothetical protein
VYIVFCVNDYIVCEHVEGGLNRSFRKDDGILFAHSIKGRTPSSLIPLLTKPNPKIVIRRDVASKGPSI